MFHGFKGVALGAALLAAGAAHAQSLKNADQPAEFPPASYTAKQYVDSKGCVYVRAGIDGNTTWVPRVSRARTQICGQTPSLAPETRVAAAPAPAPEAPVIEITPEPTVPVVAPAAKPKPKPAPRVVAKPKPAPKPAPKVIARAPKVVHQPVIQAPAVAPGCGASALSQQYLTHSKRAVRCGPQAGGHGAAAIAGASGGATLSYGTAQPQVVQGGQPGIRAKRHAQALGLAPTATANPHALVVPKHVYKQNVEEQQHTLHVPKGYRPAWEDDRLNPRRAYGTLAGKQQMDLVWTRTVPRRLIDAKTGRDVTAELPWLFYPFTSKAQLDAARLAMAQGKQVKVKVRHANTAHVSTKSVQPKAPKVVRKAQTTVRATPQKPAAAASHRFVQVGTYGNPQNARNAIRKLQQMGLPVKIGKVTRKGRPLEIVLAGPFRSQANLQRAMSAARRAGFGDAIYRK